MTWDVYKWAGPKQAYKSREPLRKFIVSKLKLEDEYFGDMVTYHSTLLAVSDILSFKSILIKAEGQKKYQQD